MTHPAPKLTAIVAATSTTLGIGKSGTLPWRLKSEMSYFARVTKRSPTSPNAVIMGRKTWESIPPAHRPLVGRINIVISRQASLPLPPATGSEGPFLANSLDSALELLKRDFGDGGVGKLFVIGGAEIYNIAMQHPDMENVLLTRVDGDFDCDTFFPVDVRKEPWVKRGYEELCEFVGEEVPKGVQEEAGVKYEFELYQKTQ